MAAAGLYADRPAVAAAGGLSLDLSGIAKGYAVDAVADLLAASGIAHALVEIGGELVGRGVRPDGQPWWVDLEVPPGLTLAPFRVALHGLAVATSGDYRRGEHTIDPRTGYPVVDPVASVSVIHRSALAADAWATALTVLGVHEGIAMAEREGLAARLVTVRGGVAVEHITPALAEMLADD
nr:FAD:protein FMN transferase [Sphingomonas aliaeris]